MEDELKVEDRPDLNLISKWIEDEDLIAVERVKQKAVKRRGETGWPVNELDDLHEHLRLPISLVARNMVRGIDIVASRWMLANPRTKEEIDAFYQHCGEYLYLCAFNNLMDNRYRKLLRLFKREKNNKCLSFGGGIGNEAIKLALQGNEVWYSDVPGSPVWKFAQWRAKKANLPIHFVGDIPEDINFDCIVAYNVFQLLLAETLETVLRKMVAALVPGGRLYCQSGFDFLKRVDTSQMSKSLCWEGQIAQHFDHTELWNKLITELGLQQITEQIYKKAEGGV